MLKYIGKKLLRLILLLLAISFLIFAGMHLTGIDPAAFLINPQNYDPAKIEQMRESLGLNDPLLVQYFRWLFNVLRGDFGYSLVDGMPISLTLAARLPATLELSVFSIVVSSILGIALGVMAAKHQNGVLDYITRAITVVANSFPAYFLGMCLLQVFAIKLKWFPVSGRTNPMNPHAPLFQRLDYIILPLLAQTIGAFCNVMRYTRNTILDNYQLEYVKTARAKGLKESQILFRHVLRNSVRPVMVLIMFRLTTLIGGSIVLESVFVWPGIGTVMKTALISNDYPVVMINALLVAAILLVVSLLIDVFTALLDPRVRLED